MTVLRLKKDFTICYESLDDLTKQISLATDLKAFSIKDMTIMTQIVDNPHIREVTLYLISANRDYTNKTVDIAAKLIKKVYDAPGDVLAVDIITEELIRLNEIKSSQIIDPIDKEVMSSAKALANKHCVPYSRFTKLVELGMPVEQALIIPPERLLLLAKLYKADKIVHDRKGHYIICKGEYIVPVTYRELREVYIKLKNVKGDSDE